MELLEPTSLTAAVTHMLLQYTRTLPGERYDSVLVVLLIELAKATVCLLLIVGQSMWSHGCRGGVRTCFGLAVMWSTPLERADTLRLGLPALCYLVQNNLTFVAIENLSAVVAQVLVQCKTISAAMFSILLIGRRFSGREWASFILLVVSVGIVIVSSSDLSDKSQLVSKGGVEKFVLGMSAALGAATLSGF